MSYHLACNISSKIAAVASVTGAMSSFTYDNLALNQPQFFKFTARKIPWSLTRAL